MATATGDSQSTAWQTPWLFSRSVDVAAFGGSAAVALGLLWVGAVTGVLDQTTPEWAWIPAILLVDVAHVYATAFRVYLDPGEFQRRQVLYVGVPLIAFVIGWALYSEGELLFWRVLAYLAVFHFVRQQYGWVALYRGRAGERERWGYWIDTVTIYLATIYPLVYWHAHLGQKAFQWFLPGDFVGIPGLVAEILQPVYWLSLATYAVRAIGCHRAGRGNPGKDLVVVTTALCWYVGIVTFSSDYAFTVTNVIIHGVPYIVLVHWYMRSARPRTSVTGGQARSTARTWFVLLATVWLLAYVEELVWDRTVWNQREWLFGGGLPPGLTAERIRGIVVPLLAVPQLTHYILDGFIWKRRSNPSFRLVATSTEAGEQRSSSAEPIDQR